MPDISLIVVNWNTRQLLRDCLSSITRTTGDLDTEVLVVDNASTDGSREMVRERFPDIQLLTNTENLGFARANNQAMAIARGRYALLLNSDARLLPRTLQNLHELAEREPCAGVVGAQLCNSDNTFQTSHAPFPTLWQETLVLSGMGRLLYGSWYPGFGPEDHQPRVVDWVGGACMLIRRAAFEDVGGLDEGYFLYGEEMDLCFTMRRHSWQVWYQPAAKVIHHRSASSRRLATQREAHLYRGRIRFFRKHYGERAVRVLIAQIYTFTLIKVVTHSVLRAISRGKYGREVISLSRLKESVANHGDTSSHCDPAKQRT